MLQKLFDPAKEESSRCTVQNTVIVGQGELHHRTDDNLIIYNDRFFLNLAYSENAGFRFVDHSCEAFDIKHTEVADGKGTACELIRCKFVFFGAGSVLILIEDVRKKLIGCL